MDYGDGGQWGREPSLVLDAAGRPHLAYVNFFGVTYAYHDGAAWHFETADHDCDPYHGSCAYPSLALDAAGRPHLAYMSGAPVAYLNYAYHDGASWQIETVDFSGWADRPSLALDSAGHPHIAHGQGYKFECCWQRYAYYDGLTWHIDTFEDDSGGGALALDAAGRPHIAYLYFPYPSTDSELRYTYFECTPLDGVALAGPVRLPLGITGLYSATYYPLTASLPVAFTWNNGVSGQPPPTPGRRPAPTPWC